MGEVKTDRDIDREEKSERRGGEKREKAGFPDSSSMSLLDRERTLNRRSLFTLGCVMFCINMQ